jgi:hypothetical protein
MRAGAAFPSRIKSRICGTLEKLKNQLFKKLEKL